MEIREVSNRKFYELLTSSSTFIHGFQLWSYGEVKKLYGWSPKRFIIYHNDKIIGYFQLLVKDIFRIKLGIVPFGPVLLENINSYTDAEKFQVCFKNLFKKEKVFFLLLHPYFDDNLNWLFSVFPVIDRGIGYCYTYIIDLQDSLDSIFGRFSPISRNKIRKSLKEDVLKIECSNTEELYVRFYSLIKEAIERTKGSYPPLDFFVRIKKEMGDIGNAIVFISSFKDRDVSGILLLSTGKTLVYQWAALTNDERFMRLHSQRRLIYEAIKWAKQEGYYYFDFGGVSLDQPKRTKKWGIWFFKRSFGGKLMKMSGSFILSGDQFITRLMVNLYRYYRGFLYN